jgi:hypothetical protein
VPDPIYLEDMGPARRVRPGLQLEREEAAPHKLRPSSPCHSQIWERPVRDLSKPPTGQNHLHCFRQATDSNATHASQLIGSTVDRCPLTSPEGPGSALPARNT